jgi:hypothetical protein
MARLRLDRSLTAGFQLHEIEARLAGGESMFATSAVFRALAIVASPVAGSATSAAMTATAPGDGT